MKTPALLDLFLLGCLLVMAPAAMTRPAKKEPSAYVDRVESERDE
jgi:hypothetical protein